MPSVGGERKNSAIRRQGRLTGKEGTRFTTMVPSLDEGKTSQGGGKGGARLKQAKGLKGGSCFKPIGSGDGGPIVLEK